MKLPLYKILRPDGWRAGWQRKSREQLQDRCCAWNDGLQICFLKLKGQHIVCEISLRLDLQTAVLEHA